MPNSKTRSMTSGAPMGLLLSFMLPLLLGLLFQQFYNMVDTVVVGKALGVDALAGVGSTGSISFLVLGLCNGICAGFAIPVAQKFGSRDFDGVRKYVGNMVLLTTVLALGITLLTTVNCRRILIWMRNPEDTFVYAYNYIFLIFLGIPATMLYNLLSGILRSLGDSRTPLYFLVFSSLLNVVLDILLIVKFHMGVAGAGWATLFSQLVSGVLCLVYMAKNFPILHLTRADLMPEGKYIGHLLAMGLPMGLQYSITAIGSIMLQTSVNTLGSSYMAAMTAGGKVSNFVMCPFDAMGSTITTFAGQNVGAGKPERVRTGVRDATILGIAYCILMFAVLYSCGGVLTSLFLDPNDLTAISEILPLSEQYLRVCATFYIPLLFVYLLRFTIQGLGYSSLAVVAGVFEMVARGTFALLLVPSLGFNAVCYASPAAWIMADVFLFPAYFHCLKKQGCSFRRAPHLAAVKVEG